MTIHDNENLDKKCSMWCVVYICYSNKQTFYTYFPIFIQTGAARYSFFLSGTVSFLVNVLRFPMGIGASVEPRKEMSPKETLTGWVCEELCCMDTETGIVSDTIRDTVIFNTIRVSDDRIRMLKHQYDTYRIHVRDHVWWGNICEELLLRTIDPNSPTSIL